MENTETKDLLVDKIGEMIEGLSDLEPGSRERATEVENLTKLYRLKIDETKNELEYFEKQDRRTMEDKHHEAEAALKREQMENEAKARGQEAALKREQMACEAETREREEQLKKDLDKNEWLRTIASLAANCGVSLLTLLAYNKWYHKGLKFHQTDTLTEPMTKNLVSKMTQLLPWKK